MYYSFIYYEDLDFIRTMYELPAVSFFCKTFERELNLKHFNIEVSYHFFSYSPQLSHLIHTLSLHHSHEYTYTRGRNTQLIHSQDLESGLVDTNRNSFISELHIKFLQGLCKQRANSITYVKDEDEGRFLTTVFSVDTWEQVLKSEIDKKRKLYFYFFTSNPLSTSSYPQLDARSKVLFLRHSPLLSLALLPSIYDLA